MKSRMSRSLQTLFYFFIISLISVPVWANNTDPNKNDWIPPGDWFIYFVIFVVLIGSLVSLLIIRTSLSNSAWSLSDALSEGVELTEMDENGKPTKVTKLCPSSSRMIALMGTLILILTFLAFGSFSLFAFAKTGNMPQSINGVVKFLLAGLTLFAPYTVNKFSKLFEGLAPKK